MQRKLLAHILSSSDFDLLDEVPPDAWDPPYDEIVRAIISHGGDVDSVRNAISDQGRVILSDLLVIGDSASPAKVASWVSWMHEHWVRKKLSVVLSEAANKVLSHAYDVDEAISQALSLIGEIQRSSEYSIEKAFSELIMESRRKPFALPLALGEVVSPRRGHLILVAGRPGMGKTSLLLQLSMDWARQGHVVGFITLEMSPKELLARMISMISGMSPSQVMAEQEGILREHFERIKNLPITFFSLLGSHISSVSSIIRLKRPDIAVVDYLQLIKAPGTKRYEEVSYVSRALKQVAMDADCLVVAASQLNRMPERKGDVTLADLRDSGALEQDADVVMVIQGREDSRSIKVLKNRHGPVGSVEVGWDGSQFIF